jgi:hypothetical protein
MSMAAHAVPVVDVFAQARVELERLFMQLTEAGACSHVALGKRVTDGLARVATETLQGHLDALFEQERQEVKLWPRPEGSDVRVRTRHLETEHGRMRVRRHGYRLAGEPHAGFPLDQALCQQAREIAEI